MLNSWIRTESNFINFVLHHPALYNKPIFNVQHCSLPKLVQGHLIYGKFKLSMKKLLTDKKKIVVLSHIINSLCLTNYWLKFYPQIRNVHIQLASGLTPRSITGWKQEVAGNKNVINHVPLTSYHKSNTCTLIVSMALPTYADYSWWEVMHY